MQDDARVNLGIEDTESPGTTDVDTFLMDLASEKQLRIVTTDTNLARVAEIRGITVLNLHDLGAVLRDPAIPGERIDLEVVREGESEGQGVGFLPDGTMVVVDDASDRVGRTVGVIITNAVQTSAGRLVFAKVSPDQPDTIKRAATHQPRHTGPGPHDR